jgi:hypothetical protein
MIALAGVAAAVLVVAGIMIWSSGRGGTNDPTTGPAADQTQAAASTPAPVQDTQPPRNPEATAARVRELPSGRAQDTATARSSEISGLFAEGAINPGRNPLAGLKSAPQGGPTTRTGGDDAGLKELLALTRSWSSRSSLSDEELKRLARLQVDACPTFAQPCSSQASEAVRSLSETVCNRQAGPVPPASDEKASIKYELAKSSCLQKSMGVVLDMMDEMAKGAIRNIKPG